MDFHMLTFLICNFVEMFCSPNAHYSDKTALIDQVLVLLIFLLKYISTVHNPRQTTCSKLSNEIAVCK